jgi:hypothetical protein
MENLIKKEDLYKILNKYLDKNIQNDKDKTIEKYFGVDSQNLLKGFTTKSGRFIIPQKNNLPVTSFVKVLQTFSTIFRKSLLWQRFFIY